MKMRKKIKDFFVPLVFMMLLVGIISIGGAIDYSIARSDVKASIFQLSSTGKTVEEISSFYKFSEYPHKQIFANLKRSGEFKELVRKGRESRSTR